MSLALSTAQMEWGELHVVHAWDAYGLPGGYSAALWKQWEVGSRSEIKRRLYRFVAEFDLDEDPRIHFVMGRPASGIFEIVVREGIDLLVIGTVSRTGVGGLVIGSTAEEVIGKATCSLLAVKPDELVSPVRCEKGSVSDAESGLTADGHRA
jgi:nucleotide-binding universal stress UspA family protein